MTRDYAQTVCAMCLAGVCEECTARATDRWCECWRCVRVWLDPEGDP